MEKTMYSLAHKETGELIKYSERSNKGIDFCNSATVELNDYNDTDWLVDTLSIVAWVKYGKETPWYNSDKDNPTVGSNIDLDDYLPVKVVVKTEFIDATPDFICLEDGEVLNAFDYDKKTNIVQDHPHRHLVLWIVKDHTNYKDKIGVKIQTSGHSYRVLMWAGEHQGRSTLIVSNAYYN